MPNLVRTLVTYVLLGPFRANFIHSAMSGRFEGFLWMGLIWFASIFVPSMWLLTYVPTLLAAAMLWASLRLLVRYWPSIATTQAMLVVVSTGLGAVTATVAWVLCMGMFFLVSTSHTLHTGTTEIPVAAVGSLLFVGIPIAPTGALLGALVGAWPLRGRRRSAP